MFRKAHKSARTPGPKPILGALSNRYTILYSDPFTSHIKFKFRVNNSSYLSIYLNFQENPTSRGRDTKRNGILLLDIYLGSTREYYYFLGKLL